jgi:hypothetical protein
MSFSNFNMPGLFASNPLLMNMQSPVAAQLLQQPLMAPQAAAGGFMSRITDPSNRNAMMGLASALLANSGYSTTPRSFGEIAGQGLQAFQQGQELDRIEAMRQQLPEDLRNAPIGLVSQILAQQYDPRIALEREQMDYQRGRDERLDERWERQFLSEQDYRSQNLELERAKAEAAMKAQEIENRYRMGQLGLAEAELGLKRVQAQLQQQIQGAILDSMTQPGGAATPSNRPPLDSFMR